MVGVAQIARGDLLLSDLGGRVLDLAGGLEAGLLLELAADLAGVRALGEDLRDPGWARERRRAHVLDHDPALGGRVHPIGVGSAGHASVGAGSWRDDLHGRRATAG